MGAMSSWNVGADGVASSALADDVAENKSPESASVKPETKMY